MDLIAGANSLEDDRFKTISEFKWCITFGGEVVFSWNGKNFGISVVQRETPSSPNQILISQIDGDDEEQSEKWCETADEVLEYVIDGDRLRDIITKVEVTYRNI